MTAMPDNVVSLAGVIEYKKRDAVLNLFCAMMALKSNDRDRIKKKYLENP